MWSEEIMSSHDSSQVPVFESPGTFSSPKANFEIKTCWIVAQFLAQKQVNFV